MVRAATAASERSDRWKRESRPTCPDEAGANESPALVVRSASNAMCPPMEEPGMPANPECYRVFTCWFLVCWLGERERETENCEGRCDCTRDGGDMERKGGRTTPLLKMATRSRTVAILWTIAIDLNHSRRDDEHCGERGEA